MGRKFISEHLVERKNPLLVVVGKKSEGYNVVGAVKLIQIIQQLLLNTKTDGQTVAHLRDELVGSAKLDDETTDEEYKNSDIISIGVESTNTISQKIIKELQLEKEIKKRAGYIGSFINPEGKLRVLGFGNNQELLFNVIGELISKLETNTAISEERIFTTDVSNAIQTLPPLYDHYRASYSKNPEEEAIENFIKLKKESFINNLKEIKLPKLDNNEKYKFAYYIYSEAHTSFILENYLSCLLATATCLEHLLKSFIQNSLCGRNNETIKMYDELSLIIDQLELGALTRVIKNLGISELLEKDIKNFSKRVNNLIQNRNKHTHVDRHRLRDAIIEKLKIPNDQMTNMGDDHLVAQISKHEAKESLELLKEVIEFVDKENN